MPQIIFFIIGLQIDLNRASLEELYKLPIDSSIVNEIYEYREIYGPFNSVYELRKVTGITSEIFEKIKPLVKIAVPFPPRQEWGSIIEEQKKLASEEPPSKGAIDEWEELLFLPMNINRARFDDLLMIDRMTPVDASAVMRALSQKEIKSSRDLRRITGLSHYAYTSLRRYVQFTDEYDKKLQGSFRIRLQNENRLDLGEDDNISTRISYLEQAIEDFDNTTNLLKEYYHWENGECEELKDHLGKELDTLIKIHPAPLYNFRLKASYARRLKIGAFYEPDKERIKGYVGLSNVGPLHRFYIGNYRVIWGEGLMIDNTDEYRARIYDRSTGIFGDITDNHNYKLTGTAGSFYLEPFQSRIELKPSFFYSYTVRDAIVNPDGSIWRVVQSSYLFDWQKEQLDEQVFGANFRVSPVKDLLPGAYIALEGMALEYPQKTINPAPEWIDIPLDKYDPWFYPEITQLSFSSKRRYYGSEFLLPIKNIFFSGEIVQQKDTIANIAYAYILKSKIQYDYFYLNILYRHYDIGYDNPFNRGFSEYRRFEDTPFEKPYALINPEYIAIYDDPSPKPEQGIFLETRYQITRNIILTRAYLDLFKNLCFNLPNLRGYFEIEFQPVFPVRIRYSEKIIKKYLPRPVVSTVSNTLESSIRFFFYLSNYDALRIELRRGNVILTASDFEDMDLDGGFLSFSFEHNFITGFSVEGGVALWATDGMSQWIFEDVGIDFLAGNGFKYYIVTSQKVGNLMLHLKFRQKLTQIEHFNLFNNPDIYYPDLPGVRVEDFVNTENSIKINLQLDYLF
uniref:Helix-hairpin-helix domain-containing protein n=1 Tax=candidate division WOR-3 bacterium TaxID=2052148 RepID=A0A7C4XEB1_UNCW3